MRISFIALLLVGCGADGPYTPGEQGFDEFDEWGNGISGFNPGGGAPVDTGGGGTGSANFDGTYTGTFNIDITRTSLGDTCSCSEAFLAISIQSGQVAAGSGNCNLSCGVSTNLQYRGTVQSNGFAEGTITEMGSFGFESAWVGVFSENGTGNGSFNDTLDSPFGEIVLTGMFNITKQ